MPYDDFARAVAYANAPPPVFVRVRPPIRWRRHIVLGLLTLVTMSVGHGWAFPVVFALILFAHEMGHYIACRIYDVDASLPYFLPGIPAFFGVSLLPGTFGAFIRIREPIPNRKALFDIGIAGPLAGFMVTLAFLPAAVMEITPLSHQEAMGGGIPISNPLIFKYAVPLLKGFSDGVPDASGASRPIFLAVWWGCLATMLNLIPIGQLDGGHVAYAVFGRRYNRLALPLMLVLWGLVVYSHFSFFLMAIIITLLGPRHPPLGEEEGSIGIGRKLLAVVGLLVFFLCFNPLAQTVSAPTKRPIRHHRSSPSDFAQNEGHDEAQAPSGRYLPLNSALRFSMKARVPSFMSSDEARRPNSEASSRDPSAKPASSPPFTASIPIRTASGPRDMMARAIFSQVGSNSSAGTTLLTSPIRWASSAEIRSPVRIGSSALPFPTSRGRRCVPA